MTIFLDSECKQVDDYFFKLARNGACSGPDKLLINGGSEQRFQIGMILF
jgi:hypothetical protein